MMTIEEFITDCVGLPRDIWQKNSDLDYLFSCAQHFRENPSAYVDYILDIITPRIRSSSQLDEIKGIARGLLRQGISQNDPEMDIYIAQALEIIVNDYWLLEEMAGNNVNPDIIFMLKKNISEEAIDVGRRLFGNAIRKIEAIQLHDIPLDLTKVRPLGEVVSAQALSLEETIQISPEIKRIHLIINGGRSTRVRTTLPKGVIFLEGRPLIQYTIDAGRKAGFEATVVVLGFKKEINARFLSEDIFIITQPTIEGTGHAVMNAYRVLKDFKGTLLVSYSDMPFITPESLKRLVEIHERSQALMSILTTSNEKRPEFGRLVCDKKGNYLRIAQVRREEVETNEVDAGFYCFKCPDFWEYLKQVENRNNRYEYYLTDIMNIISSANIPIRGYKTLDEIETIGINRPDELIKALEIGNFLIKKKYSHTQLDGYYKQIPTTFRDEWLGFYQQFQVPGPSPRQTHEATMEQIQRQLTQQIGAIFYYKQEDIKEDNYAAI